MPALNDVRATSRLANGGVMFLLISSVGWGLNWPVMKHLLTEWPPLSARGISGVIGGGLLMMIAVVIGQSLMVKRDQWGRLALSAVLNISSWMISMGLALLWLPASEGSVIAYTMPVWASLLAWPILGERLTPVRAISLVLAFGGLAALMGGNGIAASLEKLPGIVFALTGAFLFALGAVVAKRLPLQVPAVTSAAWQVLIGCLPVALLGLVFEHPRIAALSTVGWASMAYSTLVQFCICYVSWFAALAQLPASVATIGTLIVPVIGVAASALVLREPLGAGQITALIMTLAGVVLATRS